MRCIGRETDGATKKRPKRLGAKNLQALAFIGVGMRFPWTD